MSALDDLTKLTDFNHTAGKGESLFSKYDIPVTHFEFNYVEKCNDGRELEKILDILRSGEEGYYPDLLKCTEKRLRIVKPKSRYLRECYPVLEKRDLDINEFNKISEDLKNFVLAVDKRDKELERRKVKSLDHDVNIRTCKKELLPEEKLIDKRIPSTDYKSWDKYDPDTEILKMELAEEKEKKLAIETEKVETKLKSKKSVTFNKFATEAEADFFSEREREKGNEFFKTGNFEEALQCYTVSVSSKATVNNLNNRAVTYLKLKRYSEALEDCDRVLSLENGNIKAHTRKADVLEKLGKFKEALENIEYVIYQDPNNSVAQELADKIRNKCGGELKNTRMKIIEIED